MKLIIDIDERDYKYIQNHLDMHFLKEEQEFVFKTIANGIPLDDFLKQRKEPINKSVVESYLKKNE